MNRVIAQDLQTNKMKKILKNEGTVRLLANKKIKFVNSDNTIKIWDLNDQKLPMKKILKKYGILYMHPVLKVFGDVFATNGDVAIYDFTKNLREKYLKYLCC